MKNSIAAILLSFQCCILATSFLSFVTPLKASPANNSSWVAPIIYCGLGALAATTICSIKNNLDTKSMSIEDQRLCERLEKKYNHVITLLECPEELLQFITEKKDTFEHYDKISGLQSLLHYASSFFNSPSTEYPIIAFKTELEADIKKLTNNLLRIKHIISLIIYNMPTKMLLVPTHTLEALKKLKNEHCEILAKLNKLHDIITENDEYLYELHRLAKQRKKAEKQRKKDEQFWQRYDRHHDQRMAQKYTKPQEEIAIQPVVQQPETSKPYVPLFKHYGDIRMC